MGKSTACASSCGDFFRGSIRCTSHGMEQIPVDTFSFFFLKKKKILPFDDGFIGAVFVCAQTVGRLVRRAI